MTLENGVSMKKLFSAVLIISALCAVLFSGCSGAGFGQITSEAVVDTTDTAERYYSVLTVSAEQVSSLSSGMTYSEITDALGSTTDFGNLRMRFYYVENCGVLILSFEDEDDVCSLSGAELLDTVVNLDYQGKKFDSENTKYGYIADYMGSNFFVCCENEIIEGYRLGIADSTRIKYADGAKATEDDLAGHYVLVTWDWVIETSPGKLSCTKIVICD